MTLDEQQQDRVHGYVAEIMKILSGIPHNEAATALTVSVAALMVVWAHDSKAARDSMAKQFSKQLLDYLDQQDVVDWVKEHTTYVPAPGMRN